MSLSSLRSFSGAASFATAAFDTARTTFKAMAEAAVPPAASDSAAGSDSMPPAASHAGTGATSPAGSHAASGAVSPAGSHAASGAVSPAGSHGGSGVAPVAGSDTAGGRSNAAPVSSPPGAAEVGRAGERNSAEMRKAGIRQGIALDAYA